MSESPSSRYGAACSRAATGVLTLLIAMSCTVRDRVLDVVADGGADAPLELEDDATVDAEDAEDGTVDGRDSDVIPDIDPDTDPCDMSGTWAAKASAFALAEGLPLTQLSNNWFYFTIEDRGAEIEIVEALNCGIRVEGSVSVTLTAATTRALMERNSQVGRSGLFYLDGDSCRFEFERWFMIRGATPDRAPADFSAYGGDDALDLLQEDLPMPTAEDLEYSEDIEGDGEPGVAYQVSGIVSGTRNVAQRDWNEVQSSADFPVTPDDLDEFVAEFTYDSTEELLGITGCEAACGLLESGANPSRSQASYVRFVRVNPGDVVGEDDLETCFNVQDLIPWESP